MKKFVKDTVGHFKVLLEHSTREYELSPEHILKRLISPLCRDFVMLLEKGTKSDTWSVVEKISEVCKKV